MRASLSLNRFFEN